MLGGYGPLELHGALDTPARRGEGGHKAIACAFDYSAVEARKLLPKNPVVGAAQGLGGIFAQAVTQCGRPHQVGEHMGEDSRPKLLGSQIVDGEHDSEYDYIDRSERPLVKMV